MSRAPPRPNEVRTASEAPRVEVYLRGESVHGVRTSGWVPGVVVHAYPWGVRATYAHDGARFHESTFAPGDVRPVPTWRGDAVVVSFPTRVDHVQSGAGGAP